MQPAELPDDEVARLNALYEYSILDTEAEKAFDDLTALAAEICETPIALISLIDPHRQWFKSRFGLDAEETERDIAFCAHAIHQREIFEISDARADPRFADNPLVTDAPYIRFYAVSQLITPAGHAIGTLCVISDTPKVLTEQQKTALDALSRAVISQLELRKRNRELSELDKMNKEFLSNMSHELRTPLNAIIGLSHLMTEHQDAQSLPAIFTKYLEHIEFSGKRLLELVNSILDIQKVDAGKMTLQRDQINIRQLCHSIEGMMHSAALAKQLNLTINLAQHLPEYVWQDQAKLTQILINLINNAIKFTDAGGHVEVNVNATKDALILAVRDDGIGISQADQTRLFNRFEQLGKSRPQEGTGLGLVITKQLVELMQGKLHLSSDEGKGSLFKVTLPLEADIPDSETGKMPAKEAKTVPATPIFTTDVRILVVEDNKINQEVAKAQFSALGLNIEVAETGEQAVELCHTYTFDLIFMDMHLPGISGLEAAEMIKDQHTSVPIIALSADVFLAREWQQKTHCLDDFLTKPIDNNGLILVLNTFLPVNY